MLKEYLVAQAEKKELLNAMAVFEEFFEIDMTAAQFNMKTSDMNLLPCPPEIFSWLKGQQASAKATASESG